MAPAAKLLVQSLVNMFEPQFFYLAAALFIGNVVEAVTGFGGPIIAVTLAANFFPIDSLVPIIVPVILCMNIYIVIRHRKHINTPILIGGWHHVFSPKNRKSEPNLYDGILPWAFSGMLLGVAIFSIADNLILKLIYGAFVLCFSVSGFISLVRPSPGVRKPLPPAIGLLLQVTGGVMQGIYAAGGPLIVYYTNRVLTDKSSFRATLSVVWLILNSAIFMSHLITGKHGPETLITVAELLPVLAAGIIVGEKLHGRIPERAFRMLVYSILTLSGISLIYSSL
jgi:hypothetical protein